LVIVNSLSDHIKILAVILDINLTTSPPYPSHTGGFTSPLRELYPLRHYAERHFKTLESSKPLDAGLLIPTNSIYASSAVALASCRIHSFIHSLQNRL